MSYLIRNKKKSPIQLIVRSYEQPRSFTTLNIPGIGKGHNEKLISDEMMTEYIERIEKLGLISTKYIPNVMFGKGE